MNIKEALDTLPGTSQEIAEFLRERGFTSCKHGDSNCPIAEYVSSLTGYPVSVVSYNTVTIDYGATREIKERVDNPFAVRSFVVAFDNGEFPFLEENNG